MALLNRISDAADRRRRSAAWLLRRWALTRARPDVPEARWRFSHDAFGKPRLAPPFDALGLHHSLSHRGAFAAVLVADAPCGVDVEAPPGGLEAAQVVFGPAEQADVATHPRPAERFLQLWVAKEAVLKLLGTGLGDAPERLQLTIAPDERSASVHDGRPQLTAVPTGIAIRLWPLARGHWLAAALGASAGTLVPEEAPWSDA